MIDNCNRQVSVLRISLTSRCNLHCPYCHQEGNFYDKNKELSLSKIVKITRAAREYGFKRVKITGGEPLLRDDIFEIIRVIKKNNFEDISMVTNGVMLEGYARRLALAGLQRINIGCDSLVSNLLPKNIKVIEGGLKEALASRLHPIKLNMVILKGINDNEIDFMIEFAKSKGAILQLIELINVNDEYYQKYYFDLGIIERSLERKAKKIVVRKENARKQFFLKDVIVELIRPFHGLFCRSCKTLRVTPEGKLKPCLMLHDNLIDFEGKKSFLRAVNRRSVFNERYHTEKQHSSPGSGCGENSIKKGNH